MACRKVICTSSQLATARPSSLTRTFVQLASNSRHSNTSTVLGFLAPCIINSRATRHNHSHATHSTACRDRLSAKRAFTSSSIRPATAIVNPQKDEDGKTMEIGITPRASKRLGEIMVKDENPNLALRIQVESGGCHGFQYLMSLTTLPPLLSGKPAKVQSADSSAAGGSKSGSLGEDDIVFAADNGEAKVVMDLPSLELLKGSKVDYTMELIGSQFKIVDNPLATSSCGCGTSFDIKV